MGVKAHQRTPKEKQEIEKNKLKGSWLPGKKMKIEKKNPQEEKKPKKQNIYLEGLVRFFFVLLCLE